MKACGNLSCWESGLWVDAVMGRDFRGPQDGVNTFCSWDGHGSLGARGQTAVGRTVAHQRSPQPNPQILKNILPYRTKGTLQMWLNILRWGDYPGFLRWAQYNHVSPYKWERETRESAPEWCNMRRMDTAIADFKDEGMAASQGMRAASRSWKRQGHGFPPGASIKWHSRDIPWF